LSVSFVALDQAPERTLVVLLPEDLQPAPSSEALSERIAAAVQAETFKGKWQTGLDIVAPDGHALDRLILVGVGPVADLEKADWLSLGGYIAGRLPSGRNATLRFEVAGATLTAMQAAMVAEGATLRAYSFDRYKVKAKEKDKDKNGENGARKEAALAIAINDVAAARKAFKSRSGVADGVMLARDLVNEPPNVLTPKEFAARAEGLSKLGVEVEVLGEKELKKLGMRALLGVGQGSDNDSRVVIMRWNGGKDGDAPVAFIGKGVTFDTGGISIKPAGGMEDMKGDMAGAACVTGLMHALAARKAKVNAIGAIGLVENMPDGKAQRPGDIVTSMSGQTIEIINTDAEGRLVLADVLWHVQDAFKPTFMVDLATLTGAIMVALGQEHAGLFSNNDDLADRLLAAGKATGEKVWRMPLGAEYDKQIDSKFADMKNTGGRNGGSITAAQFLQRFVNERPWAHLDIAGTAMGSPQTEVSKGWASGFGVRLLDRLVADHYEA
jgi:leucyl aminopeptidase